ncbi:15778_t:CDS:2 [Gigaspora margarita]|uniref:15778_t:CDS:1 n=1 Tax=Gigaspora margarita TaxID=4874 RepID=A0ABN7UQ73_GIGMA|nr:15778_t:CDS:2 [Gigaspora margarita]
MGNILEAKPIVVPNEWAIITSAVEVVNDFCVTFYTSYACQGQSVKICGYQDLNNSPYSDFNNNIFSIKPDKVIMNKESPMIFTFIRSHLENKGFVKEKWERHEGASKL